MGESSPRYSGGAAPTGQQATRKRGQRGGRRRGGKSRIERLTGERQAIWRERSPRRYGTDPDPVLPEDELRAADVTRRGRTETITEELEKAYTAKPKWEAGH